MLTAAVTLATLLAYFLLLLLVSRRVSRRGGEGNDAFFRASRSSPWGLVAFGMIGASISGVTFISVPGWAKATGMTYLQMCLGFIVGYFVVAFVLLPVYYRLRLTSIYSYLGTRLGRTSRRTGALFFVLSKLCGAAARLYLACAVLEQFALRPWLGGGGGLLSFSAVTLSVLLLIWLYTRRSGIQTVVRTDVLQTLSLLIALFGVLFAVTSQMHLSPAGAVRAVAGSGMCRVWEWDWSSPQAFWRQFVSGVFIVVVMTGLDQDMMQKNLTCRSLRDAQKDMCAYGFAFLPVNALFLALGVLLYLFAARLQPAAAAEGDALLPALVASGALGAWVVVPFTIGVVAAAFSSADSALTSLTTTVCVDLIGVERRGYPARRAEATRRLVHLCVAAAVFVCIVLFRAAGSGSVINAVYVLASYTYGPLLGLFAYGLFAKGVPRGRVVPAVCVAAPLLCAALDFCAPRLWGYAFGYELLLLNGALTFAGLWAAARRR